MRHPGGREAGAIGAAAVFSPGARVALLGLFALVLVARLPQAWLHGRFMGEESSIFLAFAWHRPAAEALWRVFGGYLNLPANAITLVLARAIRAGLVPLELAPRVTMGVATAFQLVPAALILWGRGRWLENRLAVLAALGFLGLSPCIEEVFANILHIQYHLALACGLILALDVPSRGWGRGVCFAILLLAPLSGPGAVILLPLFGLRAAIDRDKDRALQALALGLAAAAQLLLFYTPSPMRGHLLDPLTLGAILMVRMGALPYLTAPIADQIAGIVHAQREGGGPGWWLVGLAVLAWGGALASQALRRVDAAFWLIGGGFAIAVVTFGAGMLPVDASQWFSPVSAERYNFLPLALLGCGMVALARREGYAGGRAVGILVAFSLLTGSVSFFAPLKDFRSGPDWALEVAAWRQDHRVLMQSWPAKWLVDLSDEDRPCSPPRIVAPQDPVYCEGNWLALVAADATFKRPWAQPK